VQWHRFDLFQWFLFVFRGSQLFHWYIAVMTTKNMQCWQHCFAQTTTFPCCLSSLLVYPHYTDRWFLLITLVLFESGYSYWLVRFCFYFFFVRTFEKLWARFLARFPESGILCFVTAFTQRRECLRQLSLERAYSYVSVYVTIVLCAGYIGFDSTDECKYCVYFI